ncbi:MAG: hypothetical protein V1793_12955 [Pseudomonadota bacterium]
MKKVRRCSTLMVAGILSVLLTTSSLFASPPVNKTGVAGKAPTSNAITTKNMNTTATTRLDQSALPVLTITRFKKYEDNTGMVAMAIGSSNTATPTSTTIDLGEDIELYWSITYKNVQAPSVAINGAPVIGTQHTASDGSLWMDGRKSFRPGTTTNYLLSASALRSSGTGSPVQTSKTLQVIVKKPVLTLLAPEVNQRTLAMKFFLKNTGDADFGPTPINVGYEVEGGTLARGTFTTPAMEIRKNQRVELGEITLPDRNRSFRTDSIRISLNAGAYYRMPLAEATGVFTHRWATSTARIDNATLNLLGMGTTCEIMIDNWNEHHGSGRAITPPDQANASFVDFNVLGNGQRMDFNLPHLVSRSSGGTLVYWTYLRNIHSLHRGDSNLFSVSNGKLKISLAFPNTDSREIKIGRIGNVGGYDGKWIDDDAPDVDLSSFTVDIMVTPSLGSGGQLTYSSVDVQITGLSASFAGGWSWLNPGFQDYITRVVRRNLDSSLTSVLNSSSIKNAIVEGINSGISATGVSITRIISVLGSGNTITVTYL